MAAQSAFLRLLFVVHAVTCDVARLTMSVENVEARLPCKSCASACARPFLSVFFQVLSRMEASNLPFHDQVCQRVLVHMCGEFGRPQLAAALLEKLRRAGIGMNAITYGRQTRHKARINKHLTTGVYHRAIMRGEWPSSARLVAIRKWTLLRISLEVICQLRAAKLTGVARDAPPPAAATASAAPSNRTHRRASSYATSEVSSTRGLAAEERKSLDNAAQPAPQALAEPMSAAIR